MYTVEADDRVVRVLDEIRQEETGLRFTLLWGWKQCRGEVQRQLKAEFGFRTDEPGHAQLPPRLSKNPQLTAISMSE